MYNLLAFITDCVMSGVYEKYNNFKIKVKEIVFTHDYQRLCITSKMYKTLSCITLFKAKKHLYIGWWKFALKNHKFFKHCALIVKLLLNVYRLDNNKCDLCTKMQANTVSHILFSCEYNEDVRQDKWKILSDRTCKNMMRDLEEIITVKRSVYMLNMLNGGYIVE